MIKLDLYYAEITNNNDPDKKGKIQIRILPEFKDISKSLLPWALPFMTSGFSATEQSIRLPEKGSKLWVLCNDKFTYFKYLYGSFIEGLFDYDSVKSSLDSITELSDSEYPNIDFELMNDGSISFHNRISGDHGFFHNTGTYHIIDTNGYVYISESNGNKVTMDNSGMILADKNDNEIIMGTTSIVINGNLEVLQ